MTWPHPHGYIIDSMRSIAAGKFKDQCLKLLDQVRERRQVIVVTKRGRPIAKLVPFTEPDDRNSLEGSILAESGDPYSTEESWDADVP